MNNSYVNEFIEKYIDLIDQGNWLDFYHLVNNNVKMSVTQSQGQVTETLFKAGIFPHNEYNIIPPAYLQLYTPSTGFEFVCPSHITTIDDYAFAMSSITSIKLNEGLKYIRYAAFLKCLDLRYPITLPKSLEFIANDAFDGAGTPPKFKVYEGSIGQEWCNTHMYSWELID
jgi:hypothetical protein